jgi:hypothetical protein
MRRIQVTQWARAMETSMPLLRSLRRAPVLRHELHDRVGAYLSKRPRDPANHQLTAVEL